MINLFHKKNRLTYHDKFWFGLDNAAKIFPAIINDEFTSVFRISAVLKDAVRIKPFLKALSETEMRFPYFKVQLKKGFFWYYLEHCALRLVVETGQKPPCRRFPKKGLMMRVIVQANTISLEFSHILTDGTGVSEFLKTLLLQYSKHIGLDLPVSFSYLKPGDEIEEEEYEDSYKRFFREEIPPMVKRSKAFHIPWPLNTPHHFNITNATIPVPELKKLASEKSVSINDYMVSAYMFVLQEIYSEAKPIRKNKKCKYIRVQVPVNLRNIFPSRTMRNFSLFVMPEIDLRLGHYSFDEILKTVYHQIRLETDEKLINKNISRNVGSEKKIYIKSIPLFLKSMILRMKYYSLGTKQYSGVLTNLGIIKLPGVTARLTDHFIFTPPPPNKMLKISCGIISFNDKLILSVGNICRSAKLEEKLFQFFRERGVNIRIISKQN